MKIRTVEYFISDTLSSLWRNRLMSIAAVSTMALSLLILGLFIMMILNLNHMASVLESQVQISIYLKDGLKEAEIHDIGTRIAKIPGVTQAKFVTKEEALKKFRERLGDQQASILEAIGDTNPLPSSYEVKVEEPSKVKPVVEAIAKIQGIENIKYGQEVIEQIFNFAHLVRIVGFVLIILLSLAALFIISNTIRITVFARRKEINIMKYVGATDAFIRWPFVLEGIILGAVGALVAVLLLTKSYITLVDFVYQTFAFLPLLPKYPFLTFLNIFLLVMGVAIGAIGSAISIKRFLKV